MTYAIYRERHNTWKNSEGRIEIKKNIYIWADVNKFEQKSKPLINSGLLGSWKLAAYVLNMQHS